MKKVLVVVFSIFPFLVSCVPSPRIVEHHKPDLHVDVEYFEDLNCFFETGCQSILPEDLGYRIFWFERPSDMLGGLDPTFPMADALTLDFQHSPDIPAVYTGTCAATIYHNYVIYIDSEVRILDSKQELVDVFAPIESRNEALSFAIAATGYSPMYDLESIENIEIFVNRLEETNVKRVSGGYIVHLFDYSLCHCGPHFINEIDVLVSGNGETTVSEPVKSYRDTRFDNVCFD